MSINTKEMPQTMWHENSTKSLNHHVIYIAKTKNKSLMTTCKLQLLAILIIQKNEVTQQWRPLSLMTGE